MKKLLSNFVLLTILVNASIAPAIAFEQDNIKISKKTKHLGSRLHTEYDGYIYEITNLSNENITIETINIHNSATSEAAYSAVSRSSLAIGAKTIGSRLLHAVPTLTLSLVCGVVATPIKMIANTSGNIGAKMESKKYNQLAKDNTILAPNKTLKIKILGSKSDTKPTIKIFYYRLDSEEVKTIEY